MLDYLDDIRSDLSVFHRVDVMEQMNSVLFARLAPRLSAYQGVMAARVNQELAEDEGEFEQQPVAPAPEPFVPTAEQPFPIPEGADTTPPEYAPLSDPAFAGWVQHAEVTPNA